MCPAKGTNEELEELALCLSAAATAFDRYFDVVPAADARAAVEIVVNSSPRWNLTPLDDIDGSSSNPAKEQTTKYKQA